jgi:hypothetical protein
LSAGAASMKERTDQTEALLEQGVEKVDVVWKWCIPWYIDVYSIPWFMALLVILY